MRNLQDNGYIIQKKTSSDYCGVDGENWYLNYLSDKTYFKEFYDEHIDKAWADSNYLDCCSDLAYMRCYIEESLKLGIEYKVLLCSTSKLEPKLVIHDLGQLENVLGYDYAYSGGSYYSCVLNDVISGRIQEFGKIKLNEYGLFDSYEEAEAFKEFREEIKLKNSSYEFEEGDFVIYKISEVCV